MKRYFLFLVISLALLISCGENKDKDRLEETSLDEVIEKGESLNNDINKAEQKWKIRQQKGDTLPIDYKVLLEIMPNIDGYSKQKPEGMNINTNGISYSSAIQNYTGNNGDLDISIFDYNGEINLLAAASGWKLMTMKMEDEEGYRSAEMYNGFKDTWIYTEYNKPNKNAVVMMAINDRYLLSVNANGQESIDFTKKIAEQVLNNNKNLFSK